MIFQGSGLSLPRFSREIPAQITLGTGDAPRRFAQTLFDGGILRDSDWVGDFESSINHGLTRWINADLGLDRLQKFPLVFGYAEHPQPDRTEFPCGDDVGCFELIADDGPDLYFVGHSLEMLNELAPNAGFAVFKVLTHALDQTLGCWTPSDAFEYLQWGDYFDQVLMDEISEAEKEGRKPALMDTPSTYRLCKFCPYAVTNDEMKPRFNPQRALRKAQKRALHGSWEMRVLSLVEDIQFWMPQFAPLSNGRDLLEHIEEESTEMDTIYSGIAKIAWQRGDGVDQIKDTLNEDAWNTGAYSTTLMWSPWNLNDPQSIRSALEPFRHAAPIIRACDEILALLHTPRTMTTMADAKPFKTYRVPPSEMQRWRDLWPDNKKNKPQPEPNGKSLAEVLGVEDDGAEMVTQL